MAVGTTLISVEEYLRTNYEPRCEYIEGVLRQKPMPSWDHGALEAQFCQLVNLGFPDFAAASEVNVQIRPDKYLIPDVIIQRRDRIQKPYPILPVHVCIEILSPEDRMSELFAKCEQYHDWGVESAWVIDPASRRAWEYRKAQLPSEIAPAGALTAEGISLPLSEIFSVL
ncbi:MAG TPA: Uma2 family endonuclease [Bryobacteraceae bacterium]|nr:Uma2 family endonuclease [Bryobacteraceae bacterium]